MLLPAASGLRHPEPRGSPKPITAYRLDQTSIVFLPAYIASHDHMVFAVWAPGLLAPHLERRVVIVSTFKF